MILSSASNIISILEGGENTFASTGVAITAAVLTYTVNQFYGYKDLERQPISYIYNIDKKLNK